MPAPSRVYDVVTIRFAYWNCPSAAVPTKLPAARIGTRSPTLRTRLPARTCRPYLISSRHIGTELSRSCGRHWTRVHESTKSVTANAYCPATSPQTPIPSDVAMIATTPNASDAAGWTMTRRRNEKRR